MPERQRTEATKYNCLSQSQIMYINIADFFTIFNTNMYKLFMQEF